MSPLCGVICDSTNCIGNQVTLGDNTEREREREREIEMIITSTIQATKYKDKI